MTEEELCTLSEEIRARLVETVSHTGGHLASNLGVVELTIALHRCFDPQSDRIIWDVGHQSYVHKLLTGREEQFDTLRTLGGLSGFPKRQESPADAFDTGHSTTSISAAMGFAHARDLRGGKEHVAAVIGDGAMTGGMAYEALNDAGRQKTPLLVVLNDNEMSISKNVGAMELYLSKLRSRHGYVDLKKRIANRFPRLTVRLERCRDSIKYLLLPSTFFEELGFKYFGPIDGHDIAAMETIFSRVKDLERPVLVHVVTKKGKGYSFAEKNPERFHGVAPFLVETGSEKKRSAKSNSACFGETLCALAKTDERIVAVTAAMPKGTGLSPFAEQFPARFFDVGIAEQHAVTMCARMAAAGMRPVFAVYSSFLQRAYDQLFHDVCLQNLPVLTAVDRSGPVGEDGPTHHGAFDVGYLTQMPHLTVFSPSTQQELAAMVRCALTLPGPCAIRYGRDALPEGEEPGEIAPGKWKLLRPVKSVTLAATGRMTALAAEAAAALEKEGIDCGLYSVLCLKPMDEEALEALSRCALVVTLEDGALSGGMGEHIARRLSETPARVHCMGLPDEPLPAGKNEQLLALAGLDVPSIEKTVRRLFQKQQEENELA